MLLGYLRNPTPLIVRIIKNTKEGTMFKITRPTAPLLLIFVSVTIFYVYAQQNSYPSEDQNLKSQYDYSIARVLGEVFVLSNPWNDPNELAEYVEKHASYFNANSVMIITMKDVGNWLINNDKSTIQEKCKKSLDKLILQYDLPQNYSKQIIEDFKASNINCHELGNELLWLADNLPKLKDGELYAYLKAAGDHRSEIQKLMEVPPAWNISDPEVDEIIMNDNHCHDKELADQICLISLLSIFKE